MDELRRQVHRRKPIVLTTEEGREFIARPLPWQQRNDLGQEVLQQNVAATNEAVRLIHDEAGVAQVEARLSEPLSDPLEVLKKGYPQSRPQDFEGLSYDELFDLIHATLDVNHLERLWRLLDPNSSPPEKTGGENSSGERTAQEQPTGAKTESTVDSSSQDSTED